MSTVPEKNESSDRHEVKPPKSFSGWMKEIPPLTVILAVLAILAILVINFTVTGSDELAVDQARSKLAVTFSIATVVLAFITILGAFLSTGADVKERCGLAFQVLTPLIGIMGTILGFYFGTSSAGVPVSPLKIVNVIASDDVVPEGTPLNLTVLVQGGHGPWQYTLDFGGDIKTVEKKVGAPFLSESVVAPKLKAGTESAAIGITVTVTDATGTTAEWSRPAKQWVTVTPAKPAAEVPSPSVPSPSGLQPRPTTPAQGGTPPVAAAN